MADDRHKGANNGQQGRAAKQREDWKAVQWLHEGGGPDHQHHSIDHQPAIEKCDPRPRTTTYRYKHARMRLCRREAALMTDSVSGSSCATAVRSVGPHGRAVADTWTRHSERRGGLWSVSLSISSARLDRCDVVILDADWLGRIPGRYFVTFLQKRSAE